ncbi:hypothetical protein KSP39_PZI017868 [Platanthera zijinensis]|uniref:Uncharacterized protein n=1 Tax=Platanthera zijinensis TaxID=2320716 RepID=A0AAP0B618_9ASPA
MGDMTCKRKLIERVNLPRGLLPLNELEEGLSNFVQHLLVLKADMIDCIVYNNARNNYVKCRIVINMGAR